jgi:hypothetical protein
VRLLVERGAFPIGAVLGVGGFVGALAVGFLHLDHLPITLCLFKLTTGLPCLTCGSTRAFGRLFHLDPLGALAMNPLMAAAALVVAAWGVADLALLPSRSALRLAVGAREERALWFASVLALVLNWAYVIAVGR